MILKKFQDNYDAEFVKLMLEVQKLIENFSKSDKLKINSWAKKLCVPTMNNEFKKNRNLYAIKLLDNVINGKLEDPFTKFAKEKEIKLLDAILVKTQLTNTFLNYIKNLEEEENIYNNPNNTNYQYMEKKNKPRSKTNKKNNLIKSDIKDKKIPKKYNSKNNFRIDYYDQILLAPFRHKRNNTSYKISNNMNGMYLNKDNLSPSDILLMSNYNNFPYRKKSDIMELRGYKYNRYEKYKLKNIAEMLEIQRQENNEIISQNKNEIGKLKKKLSLMSLKLKNIYEQQN
jgi:hypothetical protein